MISCYYLLSCSTKVRFYLPTTVWGIDVFWKWCSNALVLSTKKFNLRLRGDGTYRHDRCLPTGFDLTREAYEYGGHDAAAAEEYGGHDAAAAAAEEYGGHDAAGGVVFDQVGFTNEVCTLCCSKTCTEFSMDYDAYVYAFGVECVSAWTWW